MFRKSKVIYSINDLFSPDYFKKNVYQGGTYPLQNLCKNLTKTLESMSPRARSKCRQVAVDLLLKQRLNTLYDAKSALKVLTPDTLSKVLSTLSFGISVMGLIISVLKVGNSLSVWDKSFFSLIIIIMTLSYRSMVNSEYKVSARRSLNSYLDEAIAIKEGHTDLNRL